MEAEKDRRTFQILPVDSRYYLPARARGQHVKFFIDTGSTDSVIGRRYVSPDLVQPCSLKEVHYASHSFKIIGQTTMSFVLENSESSLKISLLFYVKEETPNVGVELLAMDFLTAYQCVLDFDSEMTITLSPVAKEIDRDEYSSPFVDLGISFGTGKVFHKSFLIDTGCCTWVSLKTAREQGVQVQNRTKAVCHRFTMKSAITITAGDCSRVLRNVEAINGHTRSGLFFPEWILGGKHLKRTVINLKDRNMTFKSIKGDVTVPFLPIHAFSR